MENRFASLKVLFCYFSSYFLIEWLGPEPSTEVYDKTVIELGIVEYCKL